MIYIILFFEFFKVGLFTIGGGLASLPFLYELAEKYTWINNSMIADMIASYGIKYLDVNLLKDTTEVEIDAWIANADASRPQRKPNAPNPENIGVRCIPAVPYYRTLKLSNIQGISVLENI